MKVVSIQRWLYRKARQSEKSRQFEKATQYWNNLLKMLINQRNRRAADVTELAAIHYRLGLAHRALNDNLKSLYHLKYSVRLNSSKARYYDAFGRAYLSGGHWEVAQAQFEQAIKLDPRNPVFLRRYAWVLLMMGKSQEAVRYATKALRLKPKCVENIALVARSLVEARDYRGALEVLKPWKTVPRLQRIHEIALDKLCVSFEGAVVQVLTQGMVCDGQPFLLKDLKKARELWSFQDFATFSTSAISLPNAWAGALAWLSIQDDERSKYFSMDEVANRFSSSTQEIWPCVMRIQESLVNACFG